MARSITLILGNGLGSNLGPNFNLTSDAGTVTPSTATKSELLAGLIVSVEDATTSVTVTSTGPCTNSITQSLPCPPLTTTSTSTSTSTSTTSTSTSTSTTTSPPTPTISVKFYSTGTGGSLASLTCASTSSYDVEIFGDPGNDSPTFCGPDELLSVDITNILNDGHSIPVGSTFYLASGGQVRTWIRQFNDNFAYWYLDSCTAC